MSNAAAAAIQFPVSSSFDDPYVHQRVIQQFQSASLTSLTGSNSSQQAIAANRNRLGLILVNDSPSVCYVRLGAGAASSSVYSFILPPIDLTAAKAPAVTHEILGHGTFIGTINVIWASATGSLKITELT